MRVFYSLNLRVIADTTKDCCHPNTLVLTKKRPINSKETVFKLQEIDRIEMQSIKDKSNSKLKDIAQLDKFQTSVTAGGAVPTLVAGSKTETFFETASTPEQEWVTTLLAAVVDLKKSEG